MDHVDLAIEPPAEDVVALDEALRRLEAEDPRKGQIVNLRYFAGLTADATADALGVSVGTIEREWRYIRRWLHTQLRPSTRRSARGSSHAG
jgi:RNA polymerase sigma factor (sigma-70 family)